MSLRSRLLVRSLETRLVPASLVASLFPDPIASPQAGGQFGLTHALSANYRVVGSPLADDKGFAGSGFVHVFSPTTSALLYTLENPTPANNDRFGCAVELSGKYLVVGAETQASDVGFVYVYDLTSATPTTPLYTITNPAPAIGDQFGLSLGMSGTVIAVGAPSDDAGATNSGSVYLYDIGSGTPTTPFASIANPSVGATDQFGFSVSMAGKFVAVGANLDDTSGADSGIAYVFDSTSGSPGTPILTLPNPSPAAGDQFGRSVAMSGMRLVVSAVMDDTGASNAGSAYVFDLTSGTPTVPVYTLNNPAPTLNDQFGFFVAMDGSKIVAGVPVDDAGATDAGSAYVYDLTSGTPTVPVLTLPNPTPGVGDRFGIGVAIFNTTVAVGADQDDTGATNAGSAYYFDTTAGSTPTLTINSPLPGINADSFGNSVATSGKWVVVGAPSDNTGAANSGRVYVYDRTSATPTTPVYKIANPAPAANNQFGFAVAISGNLLVASSLLGDVGATDAGTAYAFDLGSGTPTVPIATLANPTPAGNDLFGFMMSMSGTRVVIGAYNDDAGATNAGSAYVFDLSSGTPGVPIVTLNNPTPAPADSFGASVAMSGNTVVVGVIGDDTLAGNSGAAYVYDLTSGTPSVPVLTIPNPTAAANDQFGVVAVSGKYVLISAYFDDTGAADAGSAYVFDLTSGTPTVPAYTLNNPAPAGSDQFGYFLAIDGTTAVVAAYFDNTGATDAGTAYVYNLASGTPTTPAATINNPTPAIDEQFGWSVALAGNTAVIGCVQDDSLSADQGGAYVYAVNPIKVATVEINGGAAQRSMVTSVKVTFNDFVTLPVNPADAFKLRRLSDSASVTLAGVVSDGKSVTLTFTGGVPMDLAGSLADGRYELTVLAAKVSGGYFDGNGDGTAGDNYVLASDTAPNPPTNIFRQFGDINGDGFTDNVDLIAFRAANGSDSTMMNYNPAFDHDGDGFIDNADFLEFRARIGMTP